MLLINALDDHAMLLIKALDDHAMLLLHCTPFKKQYVI